MNDRTSPEIHIPIPDVEAAGEEYLLDIAFDNRLEALFEQSDHDIQRFDVDVETTFEVDRDFVPFSHLYNVDGSERPTCKLKIDGLKYNGIDGSHSRVRFIPDTLYGDAATLEGNGENFTFIKGSHIKQLSPKQATGMILRATGTDSDNIDSLVEKGLIDASMYPGIAERALHITSEQLGIHSRESTIEISARESTIDLPVLIRLGKVTTESPDESTLKLVLEKVSLYPGLDAEQAYRFVVFYTQSHRTETQVVETVAEKSIRGDGYALQSVDFIHKDAQGKSTPLDSKQHDVVKLFVNAFDELIDSLPPSDSAMPVSL